MSKRKLLKLVNEKVVTGWDDPRMPTISGLRRRGYTPKSIRNFIEKVGVAKRENIIDVSLLEFCIREDLNKTSNRVMAVLNPLKLEITNYPEDKVEWLKTENNPEDESAGDREIPFSREIYIEQDDFKEEAGRKFFRLKLNGEVRLKSAYIIKANEVVKDDYGHIIKVLCTYNEDKSKSVKGTLHWVSVPHAINAEVRVYDRLFNHEAPDGDKDKDFMQYLNPNSLSIKTGYIEPNLKHAQVGDRFQFQRLGYFNVDNDSSAEKLVFNKTVGLRDNWAKKAPKQQNTPSQKQNPQRQEKSAISIIQQLGKKYTNLPAEKQKKAKEEIQKLSHSISYEELEPLFGTSVKKVGTRIATLIALKILLQNGLERNESINLFIEKAKQDKNEILVQEALED